MLAAFPAIKPYAKHQLDVGDGHTLYVEESGTPDGIPVIFLHGGPGAGTTRTNRCYFDPELYRIILFDQRGCGQSTPHCGLKNNDTEHLIADIEKIREFFNIKKWMLFGGSWGSTLALLYAQQYPKQVLSLVLRGIFLARKKDMHWLFQQGASDIFSDYWEDFTRLIPEAKRGDLVTAYSHIFHGSNELARMAAAKAWATWEGRIATLHPNPEVVSQFSDPPMAMPIALLECHYFMHNCFIDENQIIDNIDKLKDIPGIIVHGRYDTICLLENAWTLHNAWPQSELNIIRDAGHSGSEPGIVDALIRATNIMAKRFGE